MIETELTDRMIFVGGAPRSGTTLVQNILDTHPDICGGPEFLHLPDIIRVRKLLHSSIERGWIALYCSKEDVDKYIRNLILDLLLPLKKQCGARYLSEKTPDNALVFSDLVSLFPDAYFVHVVRDPRSVVASMLEVGNRAREKNLKIPHYTENVTAAINYTKRCIRSGFEAAKLAPNRVYTVVYEALVTQPEDQTRRMFDFLSIDWTPHVLKPGEQEHLGEAAITQHSNEIWFTKGSYYRNPDTESLDKWKSALTSGQHGTILRAFGDMQELRELGYNLTFNEMAPFARVAGTLGAQWTRVVNKGRGFLIRAANL